MSQQYADIIIDISHSAIDRVFQYRIPDVLLEKVQVGSLVEVPFGTHNAKRQGYVIAITKTPSYDAAMIKEIYGIAEKSIPMEGKLIQLAAWMKETYGTTMNCALQTVMPVKQTVRRTQQKTQVEELEIEKPPVVSLSEEQRKLVDAFVNDYRQGKHKTYLLHGITGSGKTEVYIHCMKEVIAHQGQAILLIPEIALTYQTVARFKQHFGARVAFVHSKQSKGEKYETFRKAKEQEVDVVIGPRSALFTPCSNLQLIMIDEEHDVAFKSEHSPKYHARDVAIKRAELEGAGVILGSATPSVESYAKAKQGMYELWRLTHRPDGAMLPQVHVIDLREELRKGNRSIISRDLYMRIQDRLEKKEQIMLFMNRRGFNSFLSCRACGEAVKCPKCDVAMTYHKFQGAQSEKLMCHYCGYEKQVPTQCPGCGSKMIAGFGAGTEKIEQEIKKLFPKIRTLRMDRDTTQKKGDSARILKQFSQGKADMLIGTQMIVKGHDYSNVTLVGVIAADLSLYANDFRAGERTFDLLTQAAGRAGRGNTPGDVVIQTYQPDHYAIETAAHQDYEAFYELEMAYRRMLRYPPFYDLMQILVSGQSQAKAKACAEGLCMLLKDQMREKKFEKTAVIGPSEASIAKLNEQYRYVIYVKAPGLGAISTLREVAEHYQCDNIEVTTDVNPMTIS